MKPDRLKDVSCHYFSYNSGAMTRKPISLYSWHTDFFKKLFFNFSLDVLHVPTDGWLFPKANSSLGDLVFFLAPCHSAVLHFFSIVCLLSASLPDDKGHCPIHCSPQGPGHLQALNTYLSNKRGTKLPPPCGKVTRGPDNSRTPPPVQGRKTPGPEEQICVNNGKAKA